MFKPEAERTPGEQLLATQVRPAGGGGTEAEIDKMMKPEERAQKKELTSQIAVIEKQRPKAPPMAEIITDGDWRFAPMGAGTRRSAVRNAGSHHRTGPTAHAPARRPRQV